MTTTITTLPASRFNLTEVDRYNGIVAVYDGADVELVRAAAYDTPTSLTWDEWSAWVEWVDADDVTDATVTDPEDGVWRPGPVAALRIAAGEDAAAICADEPSLGYWS